MALAAATAAAYALVVRPRLLRWGATVEEARRRLPGDDVIERPRYQVTHAVTVHAPAADVWRWLVQIGQGRGGFYSYDWLMNLFGAEMRSADRVVPELQQLAVGDTVRMVPEDYVVPLHLVVAEVEPERALVLRAPGDPAEAWKAGVPYGTWTFVLDPIDERTTRLLDRWRHDFDPTPANLVLNKYGLEPVHFVMDRKLLLTIKHRAEQAARAAAAPRQVAS